MVEGDISESLESIEISYIYHRTRGDSYRKILSTHTNTTSHHITEVTEEGSLILIIASHLGQFWG